MEPACPQCGYRYRNEVSQKETRLWYCNRCRMLFDDSVDDDGDYSDDPTARLRRQEDKEQRRGNPAQDTW